MNAGPTQSLFAELRSLPRAYWVLVVGWFVNRFGTFVYPFLTLFLTSRGHPPSAVAWVLSANGVGQFMSSLLGGYFADRFGRRSTLVIGTLSHAVAVFALFFAPSLGAIIALMWCAGFAGGFYQPASNALLADIVPQDLRLRAYSMQRLAINAGFACGSSAAGIIMTVSVFWLFAGDAITTAAFGLIAWFLLPRGVLSSFIFIQFSSTFALEVKRRGFTLDVFGWHLSPEEVFGCILGWNGLMVAICELPMTRWTQRFDAQRVIMIGYILLGGGFALNAIQGEVMMLFGAMTIFTIGEMLSQPMRAAYVAQLAPPYMRGRYMGMLAMGATLAHIFGPHISLPLHAYAPTALWLGCGALGVLAAVVLRGPAPSQNPASKG
jgi:MFS family permease